MNKASFLANFRTVVNAPGGVTRLRELVLTLAIHGELVHSEQVREDGLSLLARIVSQREVLVNNGELSYASESSIAPGAPLPFSIPESWTTASLGQLSAIVRGVTFPASAMQRVKRDDVVVCLKTSNIQDEIDWNNLVYIAPNLVKREDQWLRVGDVVMSMANSRELVGKVALARRVPMKSAIGGFLGIIRPIVVSPEYLFIVLRSPYVQELLRQGASQTTNIANVSLAKLRPMPVPLPPLEEQNRIVAKVDELMRLCDRLEAQQQEREKLLPLLSRANHNRFVTEPTETNLRTVFCDSGSVSTEDLRETILSMAIEGKLLPQNDVEGTAWDNIIAARHAAGLATARKENRSPSDLKFRIPSSWAWVSVGDVASTRLGKMLDKQKNRGDMQPYLRNTNVHWFRFELESIKMMPFANSELEEYRLSPNDVLICEGGHGIARSAVWNNQLPDMMFQKALHRVRPLQCLNGHYLTYCLWVYERRGILKQFYTGAGIPHFTGKSLAKVTFPIPPYKEQCRIVAKVNELIARVEQLAIKRSQLTTIAASFAKAAVVAITSTEFKENEIMKPPKTEVVTSLKVGSRPKKSDMAPLTTLLLAQKAEASAKSLWQLSGLEIDVFYRQLKTEIANGWIEEDTTMREVKEVEVR